MSDFNVALGMIIRTHDDEVRAAYERGLRRGMAIAREQHEREREHFGGRYLASMWVDAEAQMEREIEEAKR